MPLFTIYGYGPTLARAYAIERPDLDTARAYATAKWPNATAGAIPFGDPPPPALTRAAERLKEKLDTPPADPLRDLIRERAESLGLTYYALAQRSGEDGPTDDAVRRYLTGRTALNSRYVSTLLDVLGWDGDIGWTDSVQLIEK